MPSIAIRQSRMMVAPYDVIVQPTAPILGIYALVESVTEGTNISFEVRRSGVQTGEVSCTYTAVSAGGTGDLVGGAQTGTVTLGSNVSSRQVTIRTVNRSGTQGTRELSVTLSAVSGGQLDPARLTARTMLTDRTSGSNWWSIYTGFSNRSNGRLSGLSYFGATQSEFTANKNRYASQVAKVDSFNGGMGHKRGQTTNTMALTLGGTITEPSNVVASGSQLDWSRAASHWSCGWRLLPAGTICVWAMDFIGWDRTTANGDHSIWQSIIDGDYRIGYINLGKRIRANIDSATMNPQGHTAPYLILRMNHENNQSNGYEVVPAYKLKYKSAMEAAIDWVREGLGPYSTDVKFMHAPAHGGNALGSYLSWCPSNVDIYSVSYHPGVEVRSQADVDAYVGGLNGNGIYTPADIRAASLANGIPIMFPEWSPRNEWGASTQTQRACSWSKEGMQAFDQFLSANDDIVITDCVYDKSILDPDSYERPDDARGARSWRDMVAYLKAHWSGEKAS